MSASRVLPDGWAKIEAGQYSHAQGRVTKGTRGWFGRRRGGMARGPYRTMLDAMVYVETGKP